MTDDKNMINTVILAQLQVGKTKEELLLSGRLIISTIRDRPIKQE